MGDSKATGRSRVGDAHVDSVEIRANVARVIGFCRGLSLNDTYLSRTFEDNAIEAISFIDARLSQINGLKAIVPSIIGKIDDIEDLAGLELPRVSLPNFYGMEEAIPMLGEVTSALSELGIEIDPNDLDIPISDYDMLDAPGELGDIDLVMGSASDYMAGTSNPLSTGESVLTDIASMGSSEAENALAPLTDNLDGVPGESEINDMLYAAQEDL